MKILILKNLIISSLMLVLALPVSAAMKSSSYIIYENVNHTFDGPVISNVADTDSGESVTVTWNTDQVSDGYVIYDSDNSFSSSQEQGTSVKNATSHSVNVTGLDAGTYYYKVKSTRINGGITTYNTVGTFTIVSSTPTPVSSGGGGVLIIDKTDKTVPEISNILVTPSSENSVLIEWETNEPATSFVEYGKNTNYGSTYGAWASSTEHNVLLVNLDPNNDYHFRVLSSDNWGNLAYSEDKVFSILKGIIDESEAKAEEDDTAKKEEEGIIIDTTNRLIDFIKRLFPEVSLNRIDSKNLEGVSSIEELSNFVPSPILSGDPRIEISDTEATIYWQTDVDSNSLVALSDEENYFANREEPYLEIRGDSEIRTKEHEVKLYGLSPNTEYHYQLRSKATIGPMAYSKDFTFKTTLESLKITSFFPQIIDNENVIFKWVTNKESDSTVKIAPFRGNILAIDESKTFKDDTQSVIHEIRISEFVAGTIYEVELISADNAGNSTSEIISHFSTSEDDLPPVITHMKADSTIFIDKSNKIQTIISWITNEPSTSRVYYQEGVYGNSVDLLEKTDLNNSYTKEHVMVITKFKPGVVYSFRVESADSGGNTSISKVHTFMTAKKKDSIIQIIIGILENTFGWMKDLF